MAISSIILAKEMEYEICSFIFVEKNIIQFTVYTIGLSITDIIRADNTFKDTV